MRPPKPIQNAVDPAEVGQECIRRLHSLTDPTAFILLTHLFTEHWINQILLKFCPNFDLTDYGKTELTYAQKLVIAFSIGKLPEKLFQNLKKLNALRNAIGHRLDFDFTKMDLNYHSTLPEFALPEYKPSYDPAAKQDHIMNVVGVVFADTYGWLHSHCVKELGFTKEAASRTGCQ
ncbi:MAG: hypothetical protein ACYDH9_17980 [Limisphaerales bacterium]